MNEGEELTTLGCASRVCVPPMSACLYMELTVDPDSASTAARGVGHTCG